MRHPPPARPQDEIDLFLLEQEEAGSDGAGGDDDADFEPEAAPPAGKKQKAADGGVAAPAVPPGGGFTLQLAPKRFLTLRSFKGKSFVVRALPPRAGRVGWGGRVAPAAHTAP